jgi:hypothetical protein
MRDRGADENGLERTGELQIGEKATAAKQERCVLDTLDRPPDPTAAAAVALSGGHSEIRYIRWLPPGRLSD